MKDVALDDTNTIYATGYTASSNFPNINALQTSLGGGYFDAFLTKISANGQIILFSTFFGGSDSDQSQGIALDPSNNIYITGYTESPNFPTANALFPNHTGYYYKDAFVSKFTPDGLTLLFSTYLGGSLPDFGYGIALDSSNHVFVIGDTQSSDLPTMNPLQSTFNGFEDVFVSKLTADGSALIHSTYFGGSLEDQEKALAVSSGGFTYVGGYTESNDFQITSNALQPSMGSTLDAFLLQISPGGSTLNYSTYFGGNDADIIYDIFLHNDCSLYFTGYTDSTDLALNNPYQSSSSGLHDAIIGILDFDDDSDGDGFSTCDGDCNDSNANIYPGATEICDGIDNDCNGTVDDAFDADGDGFSTCGVDCNDSKANIYPGATEICDGIDNDCNGNVDDGLGSIWYADTDGDGFGDPATTITACSAPTGYVANNTDCNDSEATTYPGAAEICADFIDNNCNGLVDEGCPPSLSGACNGIDNDGDNVADEYDEAVGCYDAKYLCLQISHGLCTGQISFGYVELQVKAAQINLLSPIQTAELGFELWDSSMTTLIYTFSEHWPPSLAVNPSPPGSSVTLSVSSFSPGTYNLIMTVKEQPLSGSTVNLVAPIVIPFQVIP